MKVVLRDTQNPKHARNGRNEGSSRAMSWLRFNAKVKRKSWDEFSSSLLSCSKCKNRWILWMILEIFKMWNQITVGDCLPFPVSLRRFEVLDPCWAATNGCLLTYGIHRDYRKTFLVTNFLRLLHPEIIIKEFTLAHHKENKDQSISHRIGDSFRKRWQTRWGHNSDTDICRKAVDYEFGNTGGVSVEFYGWTAKTANFGAAIRQIP